MLHCQLLTSDKFDFHCIVRWHHDRGVHQGRTARSLTRSLLVTAVAMGTTMSEPCIYDKLSESIDILRQSGYRYGMSEREIERFIKQVLETNEPRREPPQFPILRATIKVSLAFCSGLRRISVLAVMELCSLQFVVVVGFLLVMVLAFTYPQSSPQLGLVRLGSYNWSSPLSHVRLLSLPIAKKYNLQGLKHAHAASPGRCSH